MKELKEWDEDGRHYEEHIDNGINVKISFPTNLSDLEANIKNKQIKDICKKICEHKEEI